VFTLFFHLGNRQRQMTAQVATGKQFIIAGVLYHVINQRQNARFEFCDHQISSITLHLSNRHVVGCDLKAIGYLFPVKYTVS
jgi:hypothetical protein